MALRWKIALFFWGKWTWISDHSLVYTVPKFPFLRSRPTVREFRDFKHFSEEYFCADLWRVPRDIIRFFHDPNECWGVWKSFYHEIIDQHAPLGHKRIRANPVPWIAPYILVRNRNFYKVNIEMRNQIRFIYLFNLILTR